MARSWMGLLKSSSMAKKRAKTRFTLPSIMTPYWRKPSDISAPPVERPIPESSMQQHCQAHQQGLETELPYKKAKKPVPVRTGTVLLIESDQQWLWEQRPNSGLWGGLWSLPIFENELAFQQLCQSLKLISTVEPVQISHSFTHFTWILNAHIVRVESDQKEYLQAELGGEWLTPQKATQMGIPTAMKKLISAVKI